MERDTISTIGWELLIHPLYLPDMTPFGFHLFFSMSYKFSIKHFKIYRDVEKWFDPIHLKIYTVFLGGHHAWKYLKHVCIYESHSLLCMYLLKYNKDF